MKLECPNKPSCVSSLTRHAKRLVEPLFFTGDTRDVIRQLSAIVNAMPGGKVISVDTNSLQAEFTSRWFGFVDNLDFMLDNNRIDIRSMSRIGYFDFGKNRARVEKIRKVFAQSGNATV